MKKIFILSMLIAFSVQAKAELDFRERCLEVYADLSQNFTANKKDMAYAMGGGIFNGISIGTTTAALNEIFSAGPTLSAVESGSSTVAAGAGSGAAVGATSVGSTVMQAYKHRKYLTAVVGTVMEGMSGSGGIAAANLIKYLPEKSYLGYRYNDPGVLARLLVSIHNQGELCDTDLKPLSPYDLGHAIHREIRRIEEISAEGRQ